MKKLLVALVLAAVPAVLVLLGSAPSAQAQDRPSKRRPHVVVLDEIVVPGRVQRPNVFYILRRTPLTPEERDLRTGLLREVVRTVERAPF
jgi:hypothetical protein